MSGMSSMLHIALYRDAPSHHEPNERGNRRSGRNYPEKPFLFSFSSLREGLSPFGMDPQHAAHAFDPGFWMPGR